MYVYALQDSLGAILLVKRGVITRCVKVRLESGIAQGFHCINGGENAAKALANIAEPLTNAVCVSSRQQIQGEIHVEKAHVHV
jgi:hypothetical protein